MASDRYVARRLFLLGFIDVVSIAPNQAFDVLDSEAVPALFAQSNRGQVTGLRKFTNPSRGNTQESCYLTCSIKPWRAHLSSIASSHSAA